MRYRKDPSFKGALTGAGGAFTAEIIGEAIISEGHTVAKEASEKLREEGLAPTPENIEKVTKEVLHHKADIAKLVAGSVAVLTGQNASIAISTATNAVENNLVVAALPYLLPQVQAILTMTAIGVATVMACYQNQKDLQDLDAHLKERHERQNDASAQQGSSASTSSSMPPDDWEPEDHEGNKWKKNKDGRWHNDYAKDKEWTPNRPNFENTELQKVAKELYRPENRYPGGSAEMLKIEVTEGRALEH